MNYLEYNEHMRPQSFSRKRTTRKSSERVVLSMVTFVQNIKKQYGTSLESQFLEEVRASLCLLFTGDFLLIHVTVIENLLQSLLDLNLLFGVYQFGFIDGLFQININDVTSGEHVTNIDVFDEWFHRLGSFLYLFLGHGLGHLTRISCQTGHQAVREALVAVTVFERFNDYGFLTGVASGKDNYNFSGLC